MYNVLREIFDEYQDIFDFDSFHVGGDEVSLILFYILTLKKVSKNISKVALNIIYCRSIKRVGQKVKSLGMPWKK